MNSLILLALLSAPTLPASLPQGGSAFSRVDDTPTPAQDTRVVTLDITGMT